MTEPAGDLGAHDPARARPPSGLRVSFEIYPPKTPEGDAALRQALAKLTPLRPDFVSVTYGAGGSTREKTRGWVHELAQSPYGRPAAHLTCVGDSRHRIDDVLSEYWSAGVRRIVALRGDPPGGAGERYVAGPDGFANATALTAAIASRHAFDISVAAYPERHPESPSLEHDIDVLKAKADAGASRAITQFFFDPEVMLRFADRARRAGLTLPIVPGILPLTQPKTALRMAQSCGASLPARHLRLFDGLEQDAETRRLLACSLAVDLCARLKAEGFADFHFYTLNRSDVTYAICRALGVREAELDLAA